MHCPEYDGLTGLLTRESFHKRAGNITASDEGGLALVWKDDKNPAPVQEWWESRTTAKGVESIKTEILKYMSNPGEVSRTGTGWDSAKESQKLEDAAYGGYVLEDNGYDSPKKREQWFIGYAVKGNDKMIK